MRPEPRRFGLVVRLTASHAVDHGFAPWPGLTKDHYKNDANCLHACVMVGVWQCSLNGHVVCGTVYRDIRLEDLGSIAGIGYFITVLDFYLLVVIHCIRCRKRTIID